MPFPGQEQDKPPTPPAEKPEAPPGEAPPEEKEPVEKEQMTLVAEKLAEMTSILKEIKSSLMSAEAVRKEKDGAVVTTVDSPDVGDTKPESAGMKGKTQSGSPPTKRSEEPMVKSMEDRILATVRKELRLGSVEAVKPENDSLSPEGESNIKSFVKEALNGKKMTMRDIQEVEF